MTFYKESTILLIINSLKKIISVFLGPFLIAYFIKISINSVSDLSLYYIFSYLFLGIGGLFIGSLFLQKFQLIIFRISAILSFIFILLIFLFNDSLLNYLPVLSFLYGISMVFYWYPYNLFSLEKVTDDEKKSFEFKKNTLSVVISIIAPIFLGLLITSSSFRITSIIILFISLIQILLSFYITPLSNVAGDFKLKESYNELIKSKNVKYMFITEFFRGMSVSNGALEVLLIILIFNAFKTDFNLGIISSISVFIIIVFQFVYTNLIEKKYEKNIILVCTIIPSICLLILLLATNNFTLMLFYFFYTALVNVLSLIVTIKLFDISKDSLVSKDNQLEYWSIREFILNLGRVFSYFLLFLVGLSKKVDLLYYLIIIFSISIFGMSYFASKIKIDNVQDNE